MKIKTLKEQYIEFVANKLVISKEDLSDIEMKIIDIGYDLMKEKMEDIKILSDENKRISIELANLKSYHDDSENDYTDE